MAVCQVCGFSHRLTECPVCGYERTFFYGGAPTKAEQREEQERAGQYRKKILEKVKIKIPVYSYKHKIHHENARLIMEKPECEEIVIEGSQKQINEPVWFDEKFCNPGCDLPLTYVLTHIDGTSDRHSCTFQNPGMDMETLEIGVIFQPELKIRVIVGNYENYTCSEPYSLQ